MDYQYGKAARNGQQQQPPFQSVSTSQHAVKPAATLYNYRTPLSGHHAEPYHGSVPAPTAAAPSTAAPPARTANPGVAASRPTADTEVDQFRAVPPWSALHPNPAAPHLRYQSQWMHGAPQQPWNLQQQWRSPPPGTLRTPQAQAAPPGPPSLHPASQYAAAGALVKGGAAHRAEAPAGASLSGVGPGAVEGAGQPSSATARALLMAGASPQALASAAGITAGRLSVPPALQPDAHARSQSLQQPPPPQPALAAPLLPGSAPRPAGPLGMPRAPTTSASVAPLAAASPPVPAPAAAAALALPGSYQTRLAAQLGEGPTPSPAAQHPAGLLRAAAAPSSATPAPAAGAQAAARALPVQSASGAAFHVARSRARGAAAAGSIVSSAAGEGPGAGAASAGSCVHWLQADTHAWGADTRAEPSAVLQAPSALAESAHSLPQGGEGVAPLLGQQRQEAAAAVPSGLHERQLAEGVLKGRWPQPAPHQALAPAALAKEPGALHAVAGAGRGAPWPAEFPGLVAGSVGGNAHPQALQSLPPSAGHAQGRSDLRSAPAAAAAEDAAAPRLPPASVRPGAVQAVAGAAPAPVGPSPTRPPSSRLLAAGPPPRPPLQLPAEAAAHKRRQAAARQREEARRVHRQLWLQQRAVQEAAVAGYREATAAHRLRLLRLRAREEAHARRRAEAAERYAWRGQLLATLFATESRAAGLPEEDGGGCSAAGAAGRQACLAELLARGGGASAGEPSDVRRAGEGPLRGTAADGSAQDVEPVAAAGVALPGQQWSPQPAGAWPAARQGGARVPSGDARGSAGESGGAGEAGATVAGSALPASTGSRGAELTGGGQGEEAHGGEGAAGSASADSPKRQLLQGGADAQQDHAGRRKDGGVDGGSQSAQGAAGAELTLPDGATKELRRTREEERAVLPAEPAWDWRAKIAAMAAAMDAGWGIAGAAATSLDAERAEEARAGIGGGQRRAGAIGAEWHAKRARQGRA